MTITFGDFVLRKGQRIKVTFASTGSQIAIVRKITRYGTVYVSKYRAKSKSWTKPVRIYEQDVLETLD